MSATTTTAAAVKNSQKFSGQVFSWDLVGERKYVMGTMRYGRLRDFIQADVYSSVTGMGEQRELVKRHVKLLTNEMKSGRFVPTPFSIGTRQEHRDALVFSDQGKKVELEAFEDDKLPLVDANHRYAALEELRSEGNDTTRRAVDNLKIPYMLYLDGNPREDFICLQANLPVNKAHMLSIKIANGMENTKEGPFYKIAKEVAELLNTTPESAFHHLIRMDSRGSKLPLSLASLCGKGASELIFSLYGGAKITDKYEKEPIWLAQCIDMAYNALRTDKEGRELMADEKMLEPEPFGAKVGSSFLIALGNTLAARTWLRDEDEPTQESLDRMVLSALNHLDHPRKKNSSGEAKRSHYGNFAVEFFEDMSEEMGFHQGIPVALINLLSPSTFNVTKLPTIRKNKGRKPKATVGVAVPVTEEDLEDEMPLEVADLDDPDFEEDDQKIKENMKALAEQAPWDDNEDDE